MGFAQYALLALIATEQQKQHVLKDNIQIYKVKQVAQIVLLGINVAVGLNQHVLLGLIQQEVLALVQHVKKDICVLVHQIEVNAQENIINLQQGKVHV